MGSITPVLKSGHIYLSIYIQVFSCFAQNTHKVIDTHVLCSVPIFVSKIILFLDYITILLIISTCLDGQVKLTSKCR